MFTLNRVLCVGAIILPQSTSSLTLRHFASIRYIVKPKIKNPDIFEDKQRFPSLVKTVMSIMRVTSQIPDAIQAEDDLIYGPVAKAPPPRAEKEKGPKVLHPFVNSEKAFETDEPESGPPVRILLNREHDRSLVPSVTRILQQTLSPEQAFYLDRWKRKMIAELGEEDFKEYSQNLFRQEKLFHSALEDIFTSGAAWKHRDPSETPEYAPEVQGYIQSVSHILEDVSAVRATESTVQHCTLNYLGIVDCVARYRGVLCVINWKTSEILKPLLSNMYDNDVQVAAYAGALNNDANYKYQVENGLIVVAYKDGSPAHPRMLSSDVMSEYWKTWLLRLEGYREQRSSTSSSSNEKLQDV